MSEQQPQFALQRLYLKDLSFESPNTPLIFADQTQPQVDINYNVEHSQIQDSLYEVVVRLNVTVKSGDKTAFLVELQQAGAFQIAGLEGESLEHALEAFCPNIIFPYARETIDSMVVRGGFPPLMMAPINFEAIFQQRKAQQQATQQ